MSGKSESKEPAWDEVDEQLSEAADGLDGNSRGRLKRMDKNCLTYTELADLWCHNHNVALHKERLYVPASLAVLIGVVLNWKDLHWIVVLLAGVISVGIQLYQMVIINAFAVMQNRIYVRMNRRRPDFLEVVWGRQKATAVLGGAKIAPTPQRRYRPVMFTVLIGVWVSLVLVKMYLEP